MKSSFITVILTGPVTAELIYNSFAALIMEKTEFLLFTRPLPNRDFIWMPCY